MARQVWGTFSVMDHCDPNAFVAEVMLYDRLVVPSPPENDPAEWDRWNKQGWQPTRLEKLLKILGDRVYVVEWNGRRQQQWKNRYEAGKDIAQNTGDWAFAATRTELTMDLPKNVTGIQTVSNYTSLPEMEKDLGLQHTDAMPAYGGAAVAVLGHQFLVPGDPKWEYEDLLKEAVGLSSEKIFQRKRAAFRRWQREFFDDKGIIEASALKEAAEEMQDMLEEERVLIQRRKFIQHRNTRSSWAR